jgi:hypothetical protein
MKSLLNNPSQSSSTLQSSFLWFKELSRQRLGDEDKCLQVTTVVPNSRQLLKENN